MKTTKTTITEAVAGGITADRFSETDHIVRGAKIVGRRSKHGYDYTLESLRAAKPLYEGARGYVGHPQKGESRSGSYGERLFVVKNYEAKEDGGYADLHCNPEHPRYKQFAYDVKHNPEVLGFSHHADVTQSVRNGKRVVESIDKVHSVDLVNAPATTNGVFESEGDRPMTKTLKEILEAAETAGDSTLEVLEDMMAGGAMPADLPVEQADGGADAQIKAAFRSAVVAAFDDDKLDSKATLGKIKDVLNAYDKLTGASKKSDAPAEGDKAKTESLEAKVERLERTEAVRKLAATEKVNLTEISLKAAVAMESEGDRVEFVKSLPKLDAKSGPPKPPSKGVFESEGGVDVSKPLLTPADVRNFMKSC